MTSDLATMSHRDLKALAHTAKGADAKRVAQELLARFRASPGINPELREKMEAALAEVEARDSRADATLAEVQAAAAMRAAMDAAAAGARA